MDAKLPPVAVRALPPALVLAAFAADAAGAHEVGFLALLVAIPATFALMLDTYGDALAARCAPVRPLSAAAGLVLIVFSAALRSPAVVGGVPRVSVSATALSVLCTLFALVRVPRPAAVRNPRVPEPAQREDERLAA